MAVIQLPGSPTVASASAVLRRRRHRVLVRRYWPGTGEGSESDATWQPVPYLECLRCVDAAAPSKPNAELRYSYGRIKREDRSAYAVYHAPDLRDYFVRVEILPGTDFQGRPLGGYALWTGRIGDLADDPLGAASSTDRTAAGDQVLTAFGLDDELDRQPVVGAYATNDGSGYFQIDRSLVFNDRFVFGLRPIGNRSADKLDLAGQEAVAADRRRKTYAFSGTPDGDGTYALWGVRDIVEYLLAFYAPPGVTLRLGGQADALEVLQPTRFDPSGRTLHQCLTELIDRRRGVGWRLVPTDDDVRNDPWEVRVFTTVGVDVKIGDKTLKKNPNAGHVTDPSGAGHRVAGLQVRVDTLARVGEVVVAGEPVLSCFTVSPADGTLVPGWTGDQETAYVAAAAKDAKANDRLRGTDQYDNVFTTFRVPATWGWQAGDGAGGAKALANPRPNADTGSVPTGAAAPAAAPVRDWGHVLLRHLPLLKPALAEDGADERPEPEYRDPFALVYDETDKRYRYVDTGLDAASVGGSVRMLDRAFGLRVDMSPAHLLAKNHGTFTGAAGTNGTPKYDYSKLVATVAARTDARPKVVVTIGAGGGRTRYVEVPGAEVWYVVAGTVLDLDAAGNLTRQAQSACVRDDSAILREVAALAKAWYERERAVMSLTYNEINPAYPVGVYVKTVRCGPSDVRPVESVVTTVAYDLASQTTAVQTNWGELDFAALGTQAARHTLT